MKQAGFIMSIAALAAAVGALVCAIIALASRSHD